MSIADFPGRARPDACPGALQVHEAADGPLARIRLPGGAITRAQLLELAACAAELGTGVIELTSRANVQVRGLRSPAAFADRMAAAGLLPSPSHERVRNIVASPTGSLALVETLDRELCARPRLAALPGRFLFALDDGTCDVTTLKADVTHLAAEGRLLLAGVDAGLVLEQETVVPTMLAAAEAFLDERDTSEAWRIAELPDGPARIATRLGGTATDRPLPPARPRRVPLEVVVPLGRLTPGQARALATGAVRLTPWRTVVVTEQIDGTALEAAGLSTDPRWAGVTACTGRPGCAKALADVQADARRWVATLTGPAPAPVHWSGCERRCGAPPGKVTHRVATGDGYDERHQ
ncbi:precorrin-3B synthase [Nonomuraea solani]|uniref:precorrin-3B synthase n=1 Tax=Nonomuraea solani TaxID=1144553 RepID=UPI000CDEBF6C|nr:precorrin-3B synthase [Nonomuraea solani]